MSAEDLKPVWENQNKAIKLSTLKTIAAEHPGIPELKELVEKLSKE